MGCKVNSCDSYEFSIALLSYGFVLGSNFSEADIIIINSCAVTSESVRKTRQYIRKFRKLNKSAFIILTGCASILFEFENNKYLDKIIKREELVNFLLNKFNIKDKNKNKFIFKDKTRAFLKIEDGCENFCSYCIIPFTRGPIKSKSIENIREEIKELHKNGFKEVILTGINLGCYGKDINLSILDVINEVSKYFNRIRLSSLEPDTINLNLIDQISKYDSICPNFHLSLQSGSDRILKLMNRRYDIDYYVGLIDALRTKFKNSTFTTDIIVGFPGEEDEDFEKTLNIIKKVSFIKVNVFPFSPRPFTSAEKLKQIDSSLKRSRVKTAIKYSDLVSKGEILKFSGKEFDVLFEYKNQNNTYEGYTENYIRVKYYSKEDICGKIKRVIFLPDLS